MQHFLSMNGVEGSYLRVFGCDCFRCRSAQRGANLSASLLSVDDTGQTVSHILFDAGAGVVDSLIENPFLRGTQARLDWIVLTHWHPDHVINLNRLLTTYLHHREAKGLDTARIPLWCRSGTGEWLQRRQDFEWDNLITPHQSGEYEPPGVVLPPLPIHLPGVTITPVTVSHRNADRRADRPAQVRYTCAAYVVATAVSRTVLLWDIDSENDWLARPQTAAEETAVAFLSHADHLFIDTTFWQAKDHPTNHASFTHAREYARVLQPCHTHLVHISGHPDGAGNPGYGWSNTRWQKEAQQVWLAEGLPGQVSVPAMGDTFPL